VAEWGVIRESDIPSHFSKPTMAMRATLRPMSHSEPTSDPVRVQRTDFVSIPVQDMDRAKAFYRDTLGMHSPDWDANWPELETGNVSLYLVDPTATGAAFAPHTAPVALRVADVAEGKRDLEQRGVTFTGEHDTGVCKMAFFDDTEGNALMLHRRYAP
jgi:catechol 2,3-dioxygenase-like lactoylglutathione lyase family enzyme